MPALRNFKLLALLASLISSNFLFNSSAHADLYTGRWLCDFIYQSAHYPQNFVLAQGSGTISGVEEASTDGAVFANLNGTFNDTQFTLTSSYTKQSYVATIVGTVSGNSMSGTWADDRNQSGTFSCTRSNEREPALTVFCNRTGVTLTTARCSVSISDQGAPPRILPTGVINLVATGGLSPSKANCTIQQTAFSPGVGSCQVEFSLPIDFPIATAFPINAYYQGDSNFDAASTDHKLINAGCVGDQENPCSGAVALSFTDFPQILKKVLSVVLQCGGIHASDATLRELQVTPRDGLLAPLCKASFKINAKVGEIIAGVKASDIKKIGSEIPNGAAKESPGLKAIKILGEKPLSELEQIEGNQQKIEQELNKILNSKNPKALNTTLHTRAASKKLNIEFGTQSASTKSDSEKNVKIKLNKTGAAFAKALKNAGVGDIPLTVSISGTRKGIGKFSATQTLEVGLN